METANYFKLEGLDIEYPIYVNSNGRKWNFKAEYLKKMKTMTYDLNHKLMDLVIGIGFFNEIGKVFSNVPILVTSDIRVPGDKRSYYIVDYFIPRMNLMLLLTNKTEKALSTPKSKYLKDTLYNLGYDVIELQDLESKLNLSEYLLGLKKSIQLRSVPEEIIYPRYFK